MSFATPDDLAAHLGLTFDEDDQARATTLLIAASGLVRREARQTIDLIEDDVLVRNGSPYTQIMLPERPIVSIASVILDDGELVEGIDYTVRGDTLNRAVGWGSEAQALTVTYTHGWDPVPETAAAIALAAVTRMWANPFGLVSEQLGAASSTYLQGGSGSSSGLLLSDSEKSTIRRQFGRGSQSLTLR